MGWFQKTAGSESSMQIDDSEILSEDTFWRIVRADKERADRSGIPVTVAVFTVAGEKGRERDANANMLASLLRTTARHTDYVGHAGENKLGVVLWGTRKVGAYRFVNRLGEKANEYSEHCRLFVYPLPLGGQPEDDDPMVGESHPYDRDMFPELGEPESGGSSDFLSHIERVERQLVETGSVETSTTHQDDVEDCDERYAYGSAPLRMATSATVAASADADSATVAENGVPSIEDVLRKSGADAAAAETPQNTASEQLNGPEIESLEKLFIQAHPPWKRIVDIVGAAVGLVTLSPLMLPVAAAVKLTSRGPVLCRQEREGHAGQRFQIIKFRTMRDEAPAESNRLPDESLQDGSTSRETHEPQLTPIGAFLKATCLDELPQLWNVLKGDMALVGPRLLDVSESARIARWGRQRLYVMPGLTCIWQVHGKADVSFNEWMRMDIRYSKKMTLLDDVKLIFATLRQMINGNASR